MILRAGLGLLLCIGLVSNAWADIATIEINYLSMPEAESVVKLQLSSEGSVATLASKRLIIVNDDKAHIRVIRKLLKRLDQVSEQYTLYMDVESIEAYQLQSLQSDITSGGWVKLSAQLSDFNRNQYQSFSLRVSAQQKAMLEVGKFQPYEQHLTQWLESYGLVTHHSVELVSLSSGFTANIHPSGEGKVHLRIQPWLKKPDSIQGNTEMLMDLGTTQAPKQPTSHVANMRLNGQPVLVKSKPVNIVSAFTELDIPLGKSIVLVAHDRSAQMFGQAMLSAYHSSDKQYLLIKIRVEKH